jgi:hypothetical protein
MTVWRRELAHGLDETSRVDENRKVEKWDLIPASKPADMSNALAARLWPDMAVGFVRSDFWVVTDLRLRTVGTSEIVQATVDLELSGRGDRDDPNPLRRPLSWSWSTEFIEVPAEVDADGRRLENTAKEPLTGLVDFEPIRVYRGVRYVTRLPEYYAEFEQKCTNSSPVVIDGEELAPLTLKMEGLSLGEIEVTVVNRKRIEYREMPLVLKYRRATWKERFLNQGKTEYFKGEQLVFANFDYYSPDRRVACVDSQGKQVEDPVPLNEDGQRFRHRVPAPSPSDPNATELVIKEELSPKDLVFLEFLRLKKLDFNLLLR